MTSRSLEWSNQEAALLLFLLNFRLLSTCIHTVIALPVFVQHTACALLRAVCGPYTSDAKLVAARKTFHIVPKRLVALLGIHVSLCIYSELRSAHFGEAIRMCGNDGNGVLAWLSLL